MRRTRRITPTGSVLHAAGSAGSVAQPPAISNARLGMVMFLAFEAMFFASLVGAYLVFRLSSARWPPSDLPSLPLAVTWANTMVLALSAWTMAQALGALREGRRPALERALGRTMALGATFLVVQGSEWLRLIGHGLTLSAGTYGGTFYTLIGLHGAHVVGAVVWLAVVMLRTRRDHFTGGVRVPLELCGMYWFFVVGLWAALFPLVYLL